MKKIAIIGAAIISALASTQSFSDDLIKYLRPKTVPIPSDNPITADKVSLGKMLFFDPRLSRSGTMSCATCHNPSLGWSNGLDKALGDGGDNKVGRNAPTILNTAYQPFQFWDGRMKSLEEQALGPMASPNEMKRDLDQLVKDLNNVPGYVVLFNKNYPNEGITKETIAKSIATFERTVVSTESPFDKWVKGDKKAITAAQINGFNLFKGKANCTACHDGFNFTDNGFHNIGIGDADVGRFKIKPVRVLKGAFKTPTLRDVALTAPYMHDGSIATLRDVVVHYNKGGNTHEGVDPNIKPLQLTDKEIDDLTNFLKALTGAPMHIDAPSIPVKN